MTLRTPSGRSPVAYVGLSDPSFARGAKTPLAVLVENHNEIKGIRHAPPPHATLRKRVPTGVQLGAHLQTFRLAHVEHGKKVGCYAVTGNDASGALVEAWCSCCLWRAITYASTMSFLLLQDGPSAAPNGVTAAERACAIFPAGRLPSCSDRRGSRGSLRRTRWSGG